MKTRTEKAIKYLNNHRAKAGFVRSRKLIKTDIEKGAEHLIHAASFFFALALQKRFKNGFTQPELQTILQGLTPDLSDKQIKYDYWT